MKNIRLVTCLFFFFAIHTTLQPHTYPICVSTYQYKYIHCNTFCNQTREEFTSSPLGQMMQLCDDFVMQNYPKIKHTIVIQKYSQDSTDYSYIIEYKYGNTHEIQSTEVGELKNMLKGKSEYKLAPYIQFNPLDSPENVLKILEYTIRKEPYFKKQLKQLMKNIDDDDYIDNEDTLIVAEEECLEILSLPTSEKVRSFLKTLSK